MSIFLYYIRAYEYVHTCVHMHILKTYSSTPTYSPTTALFFFVCCIRKIVPATN